jgi:type I restriction enzyme, S subunit
MSALLDFVTYQELSNWSVAHLLQNHFNYNQSFPLVKIGSFLKRNKTQIDIDDKTEYKRVTIRLYNNGVSLRDSEIGKNIGTKKQFVIKKGQFLVSKIDARNAAFGVVTEEIDDAIITGNFWTFDVDYSKINPHFLTLLTTTQKFMTFCQSASNGTTGRHYLQEEKFLNTKIPLPSLEVQEKIIQNYQEKILKANAQEQEAKELETGIEGYLYSQLGIEIKEQAEKLESGLLHFSRLAQLSVWSIKELITDNKTNSNLYDVVNFDKMPKLVVDLFRGKSPKYDDNGTSTILNQKCNRWNHIAIEHAKKVNDQWFSSVKQVFFTQKNDILINSTGDGTIGRASIINEEFEGLLYDSHILLLRLNQNLVNPLYLTYFINSSLGQKQIENIKSATATKQTELGINNLNAIRFPLPPIEIQNKIAEHIEMTKQQVDRLNKTIQSNRVNAIVEFEAEIFSEA